MKGLLLPSSPRIDATVIEERLGAACERALIAVAAEGAVLLRDALTGQAYAVQRAPALPLDDVIGDEVELIVADLAPRQRLQLHNGIDAAASGAADAARAIAVQRDGQHLVIRNGRLAMKLPADGLVRPPFAGPIEALGCDDAWWGSMRLHDAQAIGAVWSEIESVGPVCVQWRTTYRWGNGGGCTWRVRWAAGSDTLLVVDEGMEDSPAVIEWLPFGDLPARAWCRGGGEKLDAMQPLLWRGPAEAQKTEGRRLLRHLGHIGYFHQWQLGWVGFTGGERRFAGVFSGWGGRWKGRGAVRMEVVEDDARGHLLRLPVRRGVRMFGLVITDESAADLAAHERPHLLNRRKRQWSDLALGKVGGWELDPPLEPRRPNLLSADDLESAPRRLAAVPEVRAALQRWTDQLPRDHHAQFPAALVRGDEAEMQRSVAALCAWADSVVDDLALGGYERVNIFRGRVAKRHAYTLDALWALGLIDAPAYRHVRRSLLLLAYVFSDRDFCRYEDYWPQLDHPDEQVAQALRHTAGNCPTPPNFASEFLSTVGVAAELFPAHPASPQWRQWSMQQLDRFLATFFHADGTYCESINYHVHALNEIVGQIYPLWHKQVRDYFAVPSIKGSFEHVCALQMPPIALRRSTSSGRAAKTLGLDARAALRASLPADGNSGHHGRPQDHKGELSVGARIYRDSDPALSAHLAHAWRAAGRLVIDLEHPLLTLLTLEPALPAIPSPCRSTWRQGLGVISKATTAEGLPIWCLFRAGRATHHMDFDQGNLNLVLGDRILLADHGYHTCDPDGRPVHAAATWLHNTLTYAEDRNLSSGYTGLEEAPEPVLVHLGEAFDWVVHRIVNTNYRDLERLTYRDLIPARPIVHLRHYLFVRPDYLLIWDVIAGADDPATFWLHPPEQVEQTGPAAFRAGNRGRPHLAIQFLQPAAPTVVENRRFGPLWSFGVRQSARGGFLTLLVPQVADRQIRAEREGRGVLRVSGRGVDDRIELPSPGCTDALPRVLRRTPQEKS